MATDLDGVRPGDRIRVRVPTRGGPRTLTGDVMSVYRNGAGQVSFLAMATGRSANRSKRYVNRVDSESLEVLERAPGRETGGNA